MLRSVCGIRRFPAVAAALVTAGVAARGLATMQTTITTYQYNDDHALTAATTTINGQSSTVYFTWDDCQPNADTPSSCTVSAGNGNLRGVGPTPGSDYTTQFGFDQRNRLTSAAASGAQSVAYTYHPASLMATATLGSGDALAFTYDASPLPQVSNLQQASTGTWASYLDDTTYLSDGTEQCLSQPRKDVAGVYTPAAGSFSPLRYDPYGTIESASSTTSSPATGAASYDLTQNPFRYTGEYTDPAWGGTYLRARWYVAQYQSFLSRDRADPVHRYGYAGANPVTNVDPSGLSFDKFLRKETTGDMAWATPLIPVWGQFVGGASLLANLPELWHHPRSINNWASYGFLVVSSALESAGEFPWLDRALGQAAAFRLRGATDIFAGMSQALVGNFKTRTGKWDVPGLLQSAEYTVGGMFWSRTVAGIGYRPYNLSISSVDRATAKYFEADDRDDHALVFRLRYKQYALSSTSPMLEWAGLGPYHEALLVVGDKDLTLAHLSNQTGLQYRSEVIWRSRDQAPSAFLAGGTTPQLNFVGLYSELDVSDAIRREHETKFNETVDVSRGKQRSIRRDYNAGITNNCHHYAGRIIRGIVGTSRVAEE